MSNELKRLYCYILKYHYKVVDRDEYNNGIRLRLRDLNIKTYTAFFIFLDRMGQRIDYEL